MYDKYLILTDAVVLPQHRQMEPFIVEEIAEDRSPRSIMDGTQCYAQYYKNQYGCKIIDLDQPLLRISNAERHHFMYAPLHTGKSLLEALILASTNPHYDKRLFIDYHFCT